MHKIFTLTFFATFLVLAVPHRSSSEPFDEHAHTPQYEENREAYLDCLAWKFNLVATLYSKIDQSAAHNSNKDEQEHKSPDFVFHRRPFIHEHLKVLPPSTAKQIVETIIEREGGFCSKELLYQTPCVLTSKKGTNHDAVFFVGSLEKRYFARIVGIIMDDPTVDQLYSFLNNHLDEYSLRYQNKNPENNYGYSVLHDSSCTDTGCYEGISYQFKNNFGLCMLKKHQKYLKDHKIFDLTPYDYHAKYLSITIDEESLRLFIERSHEIAAEYSPTPSGGPF